MNDIAIKVEKLGKRYHLGTQRRSHRTLREALGDSFARLTSGRKKRWRERVSPFDGNDTIWALKDVSFEVRQGEVVGFVPPV